LSVADQMESLLPMVIVRLAEAWARAAVGRRRVR
jgi:hypothetical protein